MKLGLQIPNFTWGIAPEQIGAKLVEISKTAESVGYESIWVMDHFFQIAVVGPAEHEMFEAYTTLGFIAAATTRVRLGTMVTGVTYRHPGVLAKQVTSLDVLSGGRAWLGIGAAWYEREHRGLGVPFPRLGERFQRLEEALQICVQMWSDDNGPYEGRHYQLAETMNSPQALSKPHPPILIGGSGEKKTLRLVAQYADACNLMGDPETVRRKLQILGEHCERLGRDYDSIEKTVLYSPDVGKDGEKAGQVIERLGAYADAGVSTAIGALRHCETMRPFETMAKDVFPAIARL